MRTKLTLLLALLTLSAGADITNVFTGTVAGDHTGDTAYTAFRKINTNFAYMVQTTGGRDVAYLEPLPVLALDAWGTWTSDWGATNLAQSAYWTNQEKWLTNVILTIKNQHLDPYNRVWIDDGWQDWQRTSTNTLTWNHTAFPLGYQWYADFAHTNGAKLYLYTATGPTTCLGRPGSDITNVYNDVQTMMSWGIDGTMFDTCNDTRAHDAVYIHSYQRVVQQAISDYHNLVLATNGFVRPFITQVVLGNGALPQTADDEVFYSANSVSTKSAYSDQPDFLSQFEAAKNAVRIFGKRMRPGHYNRMNSIYPSTLNPTLNATNMMNCMAMISATIRVGVGSRESDFAAGGYFGFDNITNVVMDKFSRPEVLAINQDPAVLCPTIVRTNPTSLAELWVKPLGSARPGTNALLFANLAATNFSFTLNVNDFGGVSNVSYTLRDPWGAANVATFTNTYTATLLPTNSVLYTVTKSPPARDQTITMTYSFVGLPTFGTGVTKIGGSLFGSQGPTPFFSDDGLKVNAATDFFGAYIPVPEWATNATIVAHWYSAYAGTVLLPMKPTYEYCHPTGRVQKNNDNDPTHVPSFNIICASGTYTRSTNVISFTQTNAPALINYQMNGSTNGSSAYILGPITVTWQ